MSKCPVQSLPLVIVFWLVECTYMMSYTSGRSSYSLHGYFELIARAKKYENLSKYYNGE